MYIVNTYFSIFSLYNPRPLHHNDSMTFSAPKNPSPAQEKNNRNQPTQVLTSILDPKLQRALKEDKKYLETTKLPIITVSATYKEDLKGLHHLKELDNLPDVVLSRAHYSMALGIAIEKWGEKIDPKKAWIVDPTNYVSHKDWKSIQITEFVGKTLARQPLLKALKDFIDKFGRQKLPILKSITPPLMYLAENIPNDKTILSLHIASGNILAEAGKKILQVITDPHVREDYLVHAELPNMKFCVFDAKTKLEFLEKASIMGKNVNPDKIIVTGPPIDPRIIASRKNKLPWQAVENGNNNPLKICLTTGGLGTNKAEIKKVMEKLLPELRRRNPRFQVMVYVSTHADIRDMVLNLAKEKRVAVKEVTPKDPANFEIGTQILQQSNSAPDTQNLILLYHPQIVDANELLIKHAFPWADGFITKPSGDMAYDAVASGAFLLTLQEWGEWEHNIREIFEQLGIARKADVENIAPQLEFLAEGNKLKNDLKETRKANFAHSNNEYKLDSKIEKSWVNQAMLNAKKIDKLFLEGSKEIVNEAMRK
jgi:hypothetical protein